ncbi:MAG: FCD domain-containing protein [Streptosporangiales bacterium]|nr:FCD domain-containing protein [Streptosporangiales bacterium]
MVVDESNSRAAAEPALARSTGPRQTSLRAAYDYVRAAVIDGTLTPGSRITVRPLAEHLRLSPTPIKAALATLEREGFVVSVPHRGYFVPEVRTKDLLEIYELREAVDGMAARRAAAAPDHVIIADELEKLLERQRTFVADGDLQTYGELDLQFHQLIWEGSGNLRLHAIADNLIAQVRLGNRLSAQVPGRLPVALDEHEAILTAIRRGDIRAAERHIRRHVRESGAALRRYARSRRGPG